MRCIKEISSWGLCWALSLTPSLDEVQGTKPVGAGVSLRQTRDLDGLASGPMDGLIPVPQGCTRADRRQDAANCVQGGARMQRMVLTPQPGAY